MNDKTFEAFGDELTKIAFFQKVRNGFMSALKEGWGGTTENPQTWMGQGRKMAPGMGRAGRMWEDFSSLGGATRGLPLGSKSMMLLGTGLMARDALRRQDPSGQERSRTERMTGLAGNTVGGLVGSALASRAMPKSRLLAPILGGIAGGMAGEKVLSSPFRAAREHRMVAQQQVPQQYQSEQGVPA
jgi:hypothetical protein